MQVTINYMSSTYKAMVESDLLQYQNLVSFPPDKLYKIIGPLVNRGLPIIII